MRPAICNAYHAHAQPLMSTDRTALAALREHAALADCLSLIDTLLAGGKKLEQKAVEVAVALMNFDDQRR
jgi:hypothetical protein